MTNQPKWKLLANLGDVNPIEHGGFFVFEDETGVYTPEAELLEPPADDEDADDPGATWRVYRFILDRCTFEHGVLSDNPFHPQKPAWFADNDPNRPQDTTGIDKLASFTGQAELELIRAFCSADPLVRAGAWRDVGEYHGFENLDQYPLTLTRKEVETRYSGIV